MENSAKIERMPASFNDMYWQGIGVGLNEEVDGVGVNVFNEQSQPMTGSNDVKIEWGYEGNEAVVDFAELEHPHYAMAIIPCGEELVWVRVVSRRGYQSETVHNLGKGMYTSFVLTQGEGLVVEDSKAALRKRLQLIYEEIGRLVQDLS